MGSSDTKPTKSSTPNAEIALDSTPPATTKKTQDQGSSANSTTPAKALPQTPKTARLKAYLKRKWWLVGILVVLLCVGGYFGYLALTNSAKHESNKVQHQAAAKSVKTPSPLTGVLVPPDEAHRWPVAVMIENHPDARPQSGLSTAGLVYEAFAEGGITRYMAVFLEGDTKGDLGPVRSARTYYLDWATELDAIYAHAGGNVDALDLIPTSNIVNVDGLQGISDSAFHRVNTKAAPHNLYSSLDNIRAKAKANGADLSNPSIPTFLYKDDLKLAQRPESAEVDVNWGGSYAVKWIYDKTTDSYSRSLAGSPDVDAANNKAITARNIIIQTVTQENIKTRIGEDGLKIGTVGSGAAKICMEGGCITGTWKKVDGKKTRFYDAAGAEIKLVRGTTWIEATPPWVVAG